MVLPRWLGLLNGQSLVKTWGLLLMLAVVLIVIDFRFVWHQMDSPDNDSSSIQVLLRDGYSRSIKKVINLQPHPSEYRAIEKLDLDSLLSRDHHNSDRLSPESRDSKIPVEKLRQDEERIEKDSQQGKVEVAGDGNRGQDPVKLLPMDFIPLNATKEAEHMLSYLRTLKLKTYSKWIVLDVTSGKCKEKVIVPSGWMILATGEPTTFTGCSAPDCLYLPSELNLDAKMKQQPHHDETAPSPVLMKNLAYLAAISHGAQFILDADCSVSLEKAIEILHFKTRKDHGPMYNETLLFNPYAHCGAWALAPKALVLASSSASAKEKPSAIPQNSRLYYVRDFDENVLVKHGVSTMSSDTSLVDGEGNNLGDRKVVGSRFDSSCPPVFLGQKSYSPAVPEISMYRQNALWSLLLPCNINSLRCVVLRSLVQQRLFRELDAFSGFYQVENSSGKTSTAGSQYTEAAVHIGQLISALDAWMCPRQFKFFECVDNLSDYLLKKRRLSQSEYIHMKSWIKILVQFGVAQPDRVNRIWRGVPKTSEVRVTLGSMKVRLEAGGVKEELLLKSRFVNNLAARCNSIPSSKEWFPVAQWRKPVIEDVVLIIVFNWNIFFWNNLPFTETMHRPFFKHIIYCVPNMEELLKEDKDDILRHVSIVEGLSDTWYFMYECVTIVAQMNIQGVRGYLQIGDDTLTNSWKYFNAPRDSMWIPKGFSTMRVDNLTHSWNWYWWKKSRGRPAVLQALADLERTSGLSSEQLLKLDKNYSKLKNSQHPVTSFLESYNKGKATFPRMRPMLPGSELWDTPTKEEAVQFLKNYYGANRMSGIVKHRALDFFYIPQVLIEGWVKFTRHFLRRNVLIELAVPAIHYGLVSKSKVKYVSASSLWRRDRNVTYSFYDESFFFLHPFKMKAHMEQKEAHDFFCEDYMNILFTELAKSTKS